MTTIVPKIQTVAALREIWSSLGELLGELSEDQWSAQSPLPGWTVELEDGGPEEVKVHFERNDDEADEIEFKAKIDDGELKVSISESDDD